MATKSTKSDSLPIVEQTESTAPELDLDKVDQPDVRESVEVSEDKAEGVSRGEWVTYVTETGVDVLALITSPAHQQVPLFDSQGNPTPVVQALTIFPPMIPPYGVLAAKGDGPGFWH